MSQEFGRNSVIVLNRHWQNALRVFGGRTAADARERANDLIECSQGMIDGLVRCDLRGLKPAIGSPEHSGADRQGHEQRGGRGHDRGAVAA